MSERGEWWSGGGVDWEVVGRENNVSMGWR